MTLPDQMSGVVLTGHGGPEKLQWRQDLPVPRPSATDVIVRVGAAGVNNTDINTRVGWYSKSDGDADDASWAGAPLRFPLIQGIDICGEIVAVGDKIDPMRIGERVLVEPCLREAQGQMLAAPWFIGSECDGGFAQFTRVAARHAYCVKSDLTDVELASFPCSYSTAENMLTRVDLRAGESVLITGASGGVGSASVQLARARGAHVIAVTSPSKAQSLLALGADQTLERDADYQALLGRNSMDVVIDLVAGPRFGDLLDVMKPGGRYAVAGAVGGPVVSLDVRTLYLKDLKFFGCTALDAEVFGNLVGLIEQKKIMPLVAETFALADIAQAQQAFADKGFTGKIVLKVA